VTTSAPLAGAELLRHLELTVTRRLDGMLHLGAIAGAISAEPAAGITADARQWWWLNRSKTYGLELAGSAILAGTRRAHHYREGRASLRVWGGGFAIGPELVYRAESQGSEDRDHVAAGGSIAFGLLEEEMQVVLQTSWLPFGGRSDLIEVGVEVGAFRYGMISLRMRRLLYQPGALFFVSLGGRLPW